MAKKKNKNSLQKLTSFETFTKYGVKTDRNEFVFYHVEPTNISVLPPEMIGNKVHDLAALLSVVPELEIMALDSCECFDDMINPLEPKSFGEADRSADTPETFRKVTRLSQHISYLKDFFRTYKDFTDSEIDTLEIMLIKLYARFGIDDTTDYSQLSSGDYPTMTDLYELTEKEYKAYDREKRNLYTEETLQNICLGIYSMCQGAEAQYFCGHTNIKDSEFICFGVKGLMDTNKRLKDTLLFNILSFMSDQLLGKGNTVAAIDELYLFLTNMTAIEYIRNGMKRVRKKESSFILASQNIEDFLIPEIREFTKPLFSIPTYTFFFNPGSISPAEFIDTVQLLMEEYLLISHPERGVCLFRCGNERYLLQVHAPAFKERLFGKAGGR